MKHTIYALLMLAGVFLPAAALAQPQALIPEFNPLCWKRDDCIAARKGINPLAGGEGWVENQPDCPGKEWGKCLPAGQTVTSIAFGGRRQFAHIGDFIKYIYSYALTIAAIVAAVVIIFSGVQWTASGGNAQVIESSKKRIVGSVVGLLIAYLSYVILATINPALVNLRLPNVWMLKNQRYFPQFCSDMSADAKQGLSFALALPAKEQKADTPKLNVIPKRTYISPEGEEVTTPFLYSFNEEKMKKTFEAMTDKGAKPAKFGEPAFECGAQFYTRGGSSNACRGHYCPPQGSVNQYCLLNQIAQEYVCTSGNVLGTLTNYSLAKELQVSLGAELWDDPAMTQVELWAVCERGEFKANTARGAFENSQDEKTQTYGVSVSNVTQWIEESKNKCKGDGGLKGFVLGVDFNEDDDSTDETHAIGKGGVDLGDLAEVGDGWFEKYFAQIPKRFFLEEKEVSKGVLLDIDATAVKDIDVDDKDWKVYFDRFGVSP